MADRDRSRSRSRSPEPPIGGDAAPEDAAPPADNAGGDAPPASGDQGAAAGGGEEVKLYVGNLDYATNEDRLKEEFSQYGTVTEVFLPTERGTQRPRGFGFVTLATREAAENAISRLDQAQLDGRTIRVNESRPKGERAPQGAGGGGGGGGGGFNAAGKDEVKLCKYCWYPLFLFLWLAPVERWMKEDLRDGSRCPPAFKKCIPFSF